MRDASSLGMYTKARIAGHPIHPMLVGFPIALYTVTIAALFAYLGTTDPFWFRAALTANLIGLGMAVLAVLFGAIDLFALPAHSSARVTGLKHAGLNVVTNLIFLIVAVVLWREWSGRTLVDGRYALDATLPIVLGLLGLVTMAIAGAFGWALVQTHHVGVKPVTGPQLPDVAVGTDFEDEETPAREREDQPGVHHIPIRH